MFNMIASEMDSLVAKDYITLIGLIITASISFITLCNSRKINNNTMYINSITKERIEPMSGLKEQVSRYLSLVSNYAFGKGSTEI
ncbi:hypothetical protein [Bacillus toyonensis]|uniref:hypothetical protein n=1 Tax=Bacillus toyonensis TaxID=155322 RepID=UPI001902D4A6|nr:hypothetical protein [Bacillus toyonensis]QQN86688.1 hypothetical protein I0K03_27800 [Bacillus toyonensis]